LASALHALPTATRAGAGSLGGALSTAATLPSPARGMLATSARHAYVNALDVTLLTAVAGITLTAVVVAFLLRPAGEALAGEARPALEAA
jgi:hypothetical protein